MTTFAELMKKKQDAQDELDKPTVTLEEIETTVQETVGTVNAKTELSPMEILRQTLKNVKQPAKPLAQSSPVENDSTDSTDLTVQSEATDNYPPQFQNPTLGDISNYVFDEQPEQSTIEITDKFNILLNDLVHATGTDIPGLLAKNLQFIKEHAFLAEILKPESIGDLVCAMRKSYGFVVQAKTARSTKTVARQQKEQSVTDSLAGLSF